MLLVLGLFAVQNPAWGSGGEVLDFLAEEARVVTASRRSQPEQDAPVVIDVITREEIEASGALHLWDLLRFRPGLDVLDGTSTSGHRGIVSIRGSPREINREMLVLIDGRAVYSVADGGIHWDSLPVQIQDIERIEIVRGPNAALYGSNAAIGLIQILTRKPQATTRAQLAGLGGSRQSWLGSASAEHGNPRLGARLSHTRRTEGPRPAIDGSGANDGIDSDVLNLRGRYQPTQDTELELWAGSAWQQLRTTAPLDPRWDFRRQFATLKLEHTRKPGNSLEATVSFQNFQQDGAPFFQGEFDVHERQFDAEVLQRLDWGDQRFQTTGGLSYRHAWLRSQRYFPTQPRQENSIVRGFLHQTARVSRRLQLVGGLALENSDTGGTAPAYQIAALWHAAPDQTFRLVHALAPNVPAIADSRRVFQPSPEIIVFGNPDLKPEHVYLFEASYQGAWWQRRLRLAGNLFYMKTTDRGSLVIQPGPPPRRASPQNINESQHRGLELEFSLHPAAGRRVWLNYTTVRLEDRLDDPLLTGSTPTHKLNLGGAATFGPWSLSAQAGYKSDYAIRSLTRLQGLEVPAGLRLDARVAFRPLQQLQLFVSGTNLQDARHREHPDGLEVSRCVYGGLSWTFESQSR